jgi:hypothetical protein
MAWVGSASGASTTTAPGVTYHLAVVLTDSSITIAKDKATLANGLHTFPRGAVIIFDFKNEGTEKLGAKLTLLTQHTFSKYEKKVTSLTVPPMPTSGKGRLLVNFYFRGTFTLAVTVNGRAGPAAKILVY